MKLNLLRWFTATALWLVFVAHVDAYSRQGHETVADLAYDSPDLTPEARAAIKKILGSETVAEAAEWPDAIKPPHGSLSATNPAKAFLHAHPNHHLWHFVDFPVGSTRYDPASGYATDRDIVSALHGCIAVLEGTGDFDHLSKPEALRYLIHLVGDCHQPLHTVSGYYDVHDAAHPQLLTPGHIPAHALKDAGGNDLYYTKTAELHAYWDDDLVMAISGKKDTTSLVAALTPDFSAKGNRTAGDYHHWPEAWATDSMQVGATAYAGIKLDRYVVVQTRGRPMPELTITLPDGYKTKGSAIERQQLLKASEHLLQLFNAIRWKS